MNNTLLVTLTLDQSKFYSKPININEAINICFTDGVDMECDFEGINQTNQIRTRYSKIDHGLFITGAEGITLSYRTGLTEPFDLYKDNTCHQTIDQLCQPWKQLQYDMDQTGTANDRCKCIRYSQAIRLEGGVSGRCVKSVKVIFLSLSFFLFNVSKTKKSQIK